MGGSRTQANKKHKTRFSSKASRHLHKTSLSDNSARVSKSTHHVAKGAKASRLQRNKMIRDQKRAEALKERRASSGSTSAPRVIVLFGLSSAVNLNSLADDVLSLLSAEGSAVQLSTVASSEFKLRATVLKAPHGDLRSCIEMAKVADLIAFVASASYAPEGTTSNYIDSFGSQCLSVFRSLGLPSTVVLIRDLPTEAKRRHNMKKLCTSDIASEFPEDCKFYEVDTKDELQKFMRHFKDQRLSVPHWRDQRPYLMAQKVDAIADSVSSENCTLVLTGYLRGRNLSVNQLVHVSGAGDYQLSKIEHIRDPVPLNARKEQDMMDADEMSDVEVVRCLVPDPLKQEPLLVENIPDPLAGEQTWPTDAEIAEANKNQEQKRSRKRSLPAGTSEYQAAWIVDDTDDDDDGSTDDDDGMVLDEKEGDITPQAVTNNFDLSDDQASLYLRDSDEETDVDSVMMDGRNLTREQLEDEIKRLKKEHADDEEFPDEVDTPIDVPARKRFAKYRGVKSFRTSTWDPKESLPSDYARIFAFDNFKRTQKHVLSKALDMEEDGNDDYILVNSFIRLHIKVPNSVASKLGNLSTTTPIVACGLLQHESKMSVLHFSIKKHDSYSEPIKAKEELVFHVGFRQFVARPIYSSDTMNSDKHKLERFLHAGRFSVASIYAPISFPQLPLIALKYADGDAAPLVAATGSLKSVNPDRIVLKKIVLTGYPQRVSKRKASVRYMFHSPEDVRWFKPVEVFTKCGRRGRIKEPVGTHGFMKCVFNEVLQQHDTVCMSLYKRTYPKWPDHGLFPIS